LIGAYIAASPEPRTKSPTQRDPVGALPPQTPCSGPIDDDVKTVVEVAGHLDLVPRVFGLNMTRVTRGGILRRERKGRCRFADSLLEICIRRVGLGSDAGDE
jgi:hypothetical protein